MGRQLQSAAAAVEAPPALAIHVPGAAILYHVALGHVHSVACLPSEGGGTLGEGCRMARWDSRRHGTAPRTRADTPKGLFEGQEGSPPGPPSEGAL